MQVSDSHKFIFFHPSRKTGGTSIAYALNHVSYDPFRDRHLRPSHVKKRLPGKFARYYKFVFVRNPWSRLVGCYGYDTMVGDDFKVGGKHHGISFKNYLHMRFAEGKHWRCPQVDYLKIDGKWVIDFIGRFEEIQKDFDIICRAVGIHKKTLPHHRKSKHKPYQEYYDTETEQMVRDAFARDIEAFEYQF